MTALIKANPQLPAAIAKLMALATPETLAEMSGGVTSGFPIISYKGKVWSVRKSGDTEMYLDGNGDPMPSIEVVLVQANATLSKIYYASQYVEGSNDSPDCFSNDGVKPDPSVQDPVNNLCANCPKNAWGSRITDAGKKARACNDARRMAVVFANDLYENGTDCQKLLLRVPPASLNPLKDYAEKVLGAKGIPFFGIVTRIGFDPQSAHPQFTFKPARFVNDDEAEAIAQLRGSEDIKRILAEAQEFPVAAPADEEANVSATAPPNAQGVATPSPAKATPAAAGNPAPAPPPKKAAMRPATEEEAGLAATTPTPAPTKPKPAAAKPAAPPAVEGEVMAAPPPKKKAAAKAAPPPAQAAPPAEEEEETPPPAAAATNGAGADFDNLLDSILNG